jgi:WLM domain
MDVSDLGNKNDGDDGRDAMPKGPRGEERPADVIGNAAKVMRIATDESKIPFRPGEGAQGLDRILELLHAHESADNNRPDHRQEDRHTDNEPRSCCASNTAASPMSMHELCHNAEPHHGRKFFKLLDRVKHGNVIAFSCNRERGRCQLEKRVEDERPDQNHARAILEYWGE